MLIGTVYPQTELGSDPATVREYATGVESLGFHHLLAYDHVLGADPLVHREWRGPYDIDTPFHEPLVLFGYLAAIAPALELVTGIVISPQRQTALLAKQAAEVDVLTKGRLRLGLGVGWNAVEYEALGQDFSTRGAREEEQITLLRKLWTEHSVSFDGRFDHVKGAGLCPMPVQRPIPIWLGGQSEAAYRRAGRLADGWFPQVVPGHSLEEAKRLVAESAGAVGREPSAIAMEGRVSMGSAPRAADELADHVERWRSSGATHLSVNTMGMGFGNVGEHLRALELAASVLEREG
jgi:probable F420-dependent oxidoreductase